SSLPRAQTIARGRSPFAAGLLPAGGTSTAQGSPFALRVVLRSTASNSLPADLQLDLTAPDGRSVPFFRTRLLVPGRGTAVRRVSVTPSQWFASLGTYRVSALLGGRRTGTVAFGVTSPRVIVPRFRDVTRTAGAETAIPDPTCGRFTNGAAWGDVNGDGYPDLFVTRLGRPAQLFVNDGHGGFREEARERGLDVRYATGAAFGDYDGDGHEDLFVTRYRGGNLLFHNDGAGHFVDMTRAAGIDDPDPGSSATWGDFDGDGTLDLYVTSYVTCVGKWTTPYALTS